MQINHILYQRIKKRLKNRISELSKLIRHKLVKLQKLEKNNLKDNNIIDICALSWNE